MDQWEWVGGEMDIVDPFDIRRSWNIEIIYGGDNNLIYSPRPSCLFPPVEGTSNTTPSAEERADSMQRRLEDVWFANMFPTSSAKHLDMHIANNHPLHTLLRAIGSGRIFDGDEHTTVVYINLLAHSGEVLKEHHTQSVNWTITINILWEI